MPGTPAGRRTWIDGLLNRGEALHKNALMLLRPKIPHELWRALSFAFGMTWEVLWAMTLGFRAPR